MKRLKLFLKRFKLFFKQFWSDSNNIIKVIACVTPFFSIFAIIATLMILGPVYISSWLFDTSKTPKMVILSFVFWFIVLVLSCFGGYIHRIWKNTE